MSRHDRTEQLRAIIRIEMSRRANRARSVRGATKKRMRDSKPPNLTIAQYQFALEYLGNGFNATQAYLAAHPKATYATARIEGSRHLAKPCIRTFIDAHAQDQWKLLQMSGDEALARVAYIARADLRLLFDETGVLRKPQEWPSDITSAIDSVVLRPDGAIKVKFASRLAALRIILEHNGKLKSSADSVDALAAAIRADIEAHGRAHL